jgi:FkbM family methyltransferase
MIRKFYSQAGQDLWVARDVFNFKTGGYFVDIGAFDGINLSNTYWLEKNLGWRGVCVEADPKTFTLLRKNRRCECVNACVGTPSRQISFISGMGPYSGASETRLNEETEKTSDGESLTLQTSSFADILRTCHAPDVIDYLSVDVEGMEEQVMSCFPFQEMRFLCATIERPNKAVRVIMQEQGYLLVADQPGLDAFYIHPQVQGGYLDYILKRSEHVLNLPFGKRIVNGAVHAVQHIFRHGLRSALRRV